LNKSGKRVAVKRGTTGHLYAMDHLKEATLLVLDKENAAVLEVVQGKADAFIYDQLSIYNNWKRNQTTTRAVLEPFQSEVWAVGIRKGDTELAAKINEFLVKFRAEAGFEKLAERFFAEERLEFKAKGVDFLF
jgi:polar amino acid transport system substrate-binding protein